MYNYKSIKKNCIITKDPSLPLPMIFNTKDTLAVVNY